MERESHSKYRIILFLAIAAVVCAFVSESAALGRFTVLYPFPQFLSLLAACAILLFILLIITRHILAAFLILYIPLTVLSAASYIKYSLTGEIMRPADLLYMFSIWGLADTGSFRFTLQMGAGIAAGAVFGICSHIFCGGKLHIRDSLYSFAVPVVLCLAVLISGADLSGSFFTGFIYDAFPSNYTPAAEYTSEYLNYRLDEIQSQPIETTFIANDGKDIKPDIIMILSESLWDITTVPTLEISDDPLKYMHELYSESIHGNFISRTFSGGTATVEYEVLTGMVLNYIDSLGYSVYPDALGDSPRSLATVLKEKGYATTVAHPYFGAFYNRNDAMPLLGFDRFLDEAIMKNEDRTGGRISDDWLFRYIIGEMDANEGPNFIFGITMQNHQPYDGDKYAENRIEVLNNNMDAELKTSTETYMEGIRQSDEALQNLVEHLRTREKPTVLVMFGDHQPGLGPDYGLYKWDGRMTDRDNMTPEQAVELLKTPFFIWSNYKSESFDAGDVGLSFIGNMVLDYIGTEKPLFYKFQDIVWNKFAHYMNREFLFIDNEGLLYADPQEDKYKLEELYKLIVYDQIYGEGYVRDRLW